MPKTATDKTKPVIPATLEDVRQKKPAQDAVEDEVDESNEESFPASDPPSHRDPDHAPTKASAG